MATLDLSTLDAATTADGVYVGVLHDRATGRVGVILNDVAVQALATWADAVSPAAHDLVADLGMSEDDADAVSTLIYALRAQLPKF